MSANQSCDNINCYCIVNYRKQRKTTYQLLIVYIVIGINITVQILHNKWVMTLLMPFAIMFYHFKIICNLRKYIWFWLIYMNYLKDETIHFFVLIFSRFDRVFSWGYFHDFDEVFSKSSWVNYCMCRIKMTFLWYVFFNIVDNWRFWKTRCHMLCMCKALLSYVSTCAVLVCFYILNITTVTSYQIRIT